jgi:AbrB family looped-hinge helix DNA binding protein
MPLVKVKEKFQITLPAPLRQRVAVAVGDMFDIAVEGKKITLTPKVVLDRALTEALDDEVHGRTLGPFKNLKTAVRALRTRRK